MGAQVQAGSSTAAEEQSNVTFSVGEKCQAIYEQDGQYYNAKVVALSEDGYFVTFLGYGNSAQVEFKEVRPYKRPDTSGWVKGMELTAVHASDGRYYDATLLEVKAASVVVCFQGESESVTVDIDTVRTKQYVERKRKPEDVEAESGSQLPKGLEILPDDSEDAIEKKKKKLKMFTRQEKRANDEKQGEGRRSTWQSFSKKNKTVKKAKNQHDPNWDPTRDHGELAARQQIDRFQAYLVRESS